MKQPVHPGHANQPYPQQPGAADPYGQQRAAGGGGYGQQPTVLVVPQGAGQAAMRDPEMGMAGQGAGIDSVSKEIRLGFVRKVFGILTAQLVLTFGIVAFFSFSTAAQAFVNRFPGLIIILFILSFGFLIALSCFPSVARKAPRNYFILGAFTVCEGLLLGFISAQYTTFSVVFAVGMTTVIVSALMLYATFTKTDFTAKGGMIMCLLLTLFLAMIIFFIFPSALTALLYGTVGTIVFSLFIVYDVQLIVGGKHRKYEYGIDDYVFAALSVYLDIVNLFIIMLVCCGEGR